MSAPHVAVVATGTANTASVIAALERLGARAALSRDPEAVRDAPHLVLPGVGTFAAARRTLEQHHLLAPLSARIAARRPTLCICVGMQLLFAASAESPGVNGLGVLPERLERFAAPQRVPHMGWNRVTPSPRARFVTAEGWGYFANSYRARRTPPAEWACAWSEHGGRFVAALESDGVLACQFHPELSGRFGLAIIERWLEQRP